MQSLFRASQERIVFPLYWLYGNTQYDFASHVIFPKAEYENTANENTAKIQLIITLI